MTNLALKPVTDAAVPAEAFWRMSVAQYHGMIDAGILTDDDPVELLGGWLIDKMPKKPRHRLTTRRIRAALERNVSADWYVDSQEPITTEDSEPEPDVVVVRGDPEDYADRHPGPQDVSLVVEVSDATLESDRTLKKKLYAEAGIPVYWIAILPEARLEVYSDPSPSTGEYRSHQVYGVDDDVEVVVRGVGRARLRIRDLIRT